MVNSEHWPLAGRRHAAPTRPAYQDDCRPCAARRTSAPPSVERSPERMRPPERGRPWRRIFRTLRFSLVRSHGFGVAVPLFLEIVHALILQDLDVLLDAAIERHGDFPGPREDL